tara:strand:+ start:41 stop:394 length:354 start_codon:yes stop_codon:yes gene_type:complete
MRIVAGRFRGKQLSSPTDVSIRPTSDRARESMFNILGSRLGPVFEGKRVLDLFAGTGALGLEALSRGAAMLPLSIRGPRRAASFAITSRPLVSQASPSCCAAMLPRLARRAPLASST